MANFVASSAIDMTSIQIGDFASGAVTTHTATVYRVTNGSDFDELSGSGFTYDVSNRLTGGTIASWTHNVGGSTVFVLSALGLSGGAFAAYVSGNNTAGFFADVLSGNDSLTGSTGNDNLLGFAGLDTLNGGNGDDTLDGGTGADKMAGGAGTDFYVVDDAGDVVTDVAGQGFDTVRSSISYTLGAATEGLELTGSANIDGVGTASNNAMTGNSGNNSLTGGNGNDTLNGGTGGADTLVGGANNDYYIVNGGDTVTELAGGGFDTVESSADFALDDNLENLTLTGSAVNGTGSAVANVIVGNGGTNVLSGQGGNDSIYGNGGTDTLDGGDGNDTLDGYNSTSQLVGGGGNDLYYVDGSDTVVEADLGGTDTVESSVSHTLAAFVENLDLVSWAANGTGNGLDNIINGSDNSNSLDGAAGDDTINGGIGNDSIDGGAGADRMAGGLDDDTYTVDDAGDLVVEGAGQGTDTVRTGLAYVLGANLENLMLTGAAAVNGTGNTLHNAMTGNSAANSLSGGTGDDTLNGNGGTDTLVGGAGNDLLIVDDGTDIVTEVAAGGLDTVQSAISFSLAANVNLENLTLTGTAASGTGNAANNVIVGNGSNNVLMGDDGNDSISGGGGTDSIDGEDGNDTLSGVGSLSTLTGGVGNDTYFVDGNDTIIDVGGIDTVNSHVNYTLAADFENLVLLGSATTGTGNALNNDITGNDYGNNLTGGDGNDTVEGGLGWDFLAGEIGVDSLVGGDGNDTLDGGDGVDRMFGGLGDDVFILSIATDVVIEGANQGFDIVQSAFAVNLAANVEALQLIGSTNLNGNGNAGHNWLIGNSGNNSLNGGAGNDTLDGGAGLDTLTGSTGNDTYRVSDTLDKIVEASTGGGLDTIESSVTFSMNSINAVENLVLLGSGDIDGTGNASHNVIWGNSGRNDILGGSGNDTIYGGGGNDDISGNLGNDHFYGGHGADTINVQYGVDRVFYTDVLDAGDTVESFSTSGTTTQDYLVLDSLFDSLGVAAANRVSRVSFVQNGARGEVWIDTDGVGGGDLMLCTLIGTGTGGLNVTTLSAGNLATNDILVGT